MHKQIKLEIMKYLGGTTSLLCLQMKTWFNDVLEMEKKSRILLMRRLTQGC